MAMDKSFGKIGKIDKVQKWQSTNAVDGFLRRYNSEVILRI